MSVRIQLRRDSSSNWTSNNPTLVEGEVGIELNTNKFKIGNGTNTWQQLSYWGEGAYQPIDADLTAIAGLAGTSGFLKKLPQIHGHLILIHMEQEPLRP